MHLLRIAYGCIMEFTLIFRGSEERENKESIRSRSVNNPIQLPPFFLEEFQNTMMAPLLYIFISSVIQQSQSVFLIRKTNKEKEILFFLYSFKHKYC